MSLSTRITLLVTVLLAACGVAAGVALHRALRRSAEAELAVRLDARLAWLEGSLDVDLDDGEAELDARPEPMGAVPGWTVSTADGRRLWASPDLPAAPTVDLTKRVSRGVPTGAPLVGGDLAPVGAGGAAGADDRAAWVAVALETTPAAVRAAAEAAVPGLNVRRVSRRARVKKKDADAVPLFDMRGTADAREYDVRVDAGGRVQRVKDRAANRFASYRVVPDVADGARLDLIITAVAPAADVEAGLARAARVLWTVGPLALLLTAGALAMTIRWQLRPLARIARQAATIGPDDPAGQIGPAGTSPELRRVRSAINQMLARLGDALGRERRFAATAAHELRTPLAQMRVTLDVALRRTRDAAEYREALADVSADVERLQRLVLGLLQLTRAQSGTAAAAAAPVPLEPLLRRAAEGHGGGGRLSSSVPAGLHVRGDPELLRAALANVIENAARHAPGEPPELRVEVCGREVRVSVSDLGPGIPASDRERIFEPLTRLDPARADECSAGGLGLGLSVARSAVRAFGGNLVAGPRADGWSGAEFVFTLLLAAPAVDAHPAK